MLHVLLVILKIIGIVILVLLLLLLFLLITVLVVPIKYQVYASKKTEIHAKVKVSWLFHFIHFGIFYDKNGLVFRVRFMGILMEKWKSFFELIKKFFRIPRIKKKSNKSTRKKINKKIKNINDNDKFLDSNKVDSKVLDSPIEKKAPDDTKEKSTKKPNYSSGKESTSKEETNGINNHIAKKKKKTPLSYIKTWLDKIINRLKEMIKNIKKLINKIILTLKNVKDKLQEIIAFIQDEENKKVFLLCKDEIIIVLKHIKPRKYKINLKFGTGDPALTGQVLGIMGMLIPFYKDNAHIVPDFEDIVFEGDFFMKGRITLLKLALIGWKLYRDENVKRCYKMIME